MPQILGLEEQRKALANIKSLIRKCQDINLFLENLPSRSTPLEISYIVSMDTADEPDEVFDNDLSEESSIEDVEKFVEEGESVSESESDNEPIAPENIQALKSKKYKAPFIATDTTIIEKYVSASKKEYVKQIRDLSDTYRIYLDDSDEAIINKFIV